jgi:hypothetical protein
MLQAQSKAQDRRISIKQAEVPHSAMSSLTPPYLRSCTFRTKVRIGKHGAGEDAANASSCCGQVRPEP